MDGTVIAISCLEDEACFLYTTLMADGKAQLSNY